ncbi:glycoside hydrolase family 3 N-terminal domain-containing protein [Rhizobium sp. RCAM05973]|uniref:glycoside hydrolase family 3 N-terminal domain-containing protein n=1 Tax=Rhizobium sp. RCAM05973 TaxID=2994066 RepID=UPI0022EBC034
MLVAVDAEIGGIERLHRLVPSLPSLDAAKRLHAPALEEQVRLTAQSARMLGANVFLSPVADVLRGPNPWLEGRTLSDDIEEASRLVSAFVKGTQSGGVAATVKHFPGHPVCELDPAIAEGVVPHSFEQLREFAPPFQAGIAAGAEVVMMGPAIFDAVNPPAPAGHSPEMVNWLRDEFSFNGVVLTDDLDWKATIRDMKIEESAIRALNAGVDWMLVSANGVRDISSMVSAISRAVEDGRLSAERIAASANKLRALAAKLSD